MDDVDLYDDVYGDLDDFDKGEKLKEVNAQIANLTERLNTAVSKNVTLRAENKRLGAANKVLKVNNASLLLTARNELKRKDAEIQALRKENHDICFRRGKSSAAAIRPPVVQVAERPPVECSTLAAQTDITFGQRDTVDVMRRAQTHLVLNVAEEARHPSSSVQKVDAAVQAIPTNWPEDHHRRHADSNGNRREHPSKIEDSDSQRKKQDHQPTFAKLVSRRQSLHVDRSSDRHTHRASHRSGRDSDGDVADRKNRDNRKRDRDRYTDHKSGSDSKRSRSDRYDVKEDEEKNRGRKRSDGEEKERLSKHDHDHTKKTTHHNETHQKTSHAKSGEIDKKSSSSKETANKDSNSNENDHTKKPSLLNQSHQKTSNAKSDEIDKKSASAKETHSDQNSKESVNNQPDKPAAASAHEGINSELEQLVSEIANENPPKSTLDQTSTEEKPIESVAEPDAAPDQSQIDIETCDEPAEPKEEEQKKASTYSQAQLESDRKVADWMADSDQTATEAEEQPDQSLIDVETIDEPEIDPTEDQQKASNRTNAQLESDRKVEDWMAMDYSTTSRPCNSDKPPRSSASTCHISLTSLNAELLKSALETVKRASNADFKATIPDGSPNTSMALNLSMVRAEEADEKVPQPPASVFSGWPSVPTSSSSLNPLNSSGTASLQFSRHPSADLFRIPAAPPIVSYRQLHDIPISPAKHIHVRVEPPAPFMSPDGWSTASSTPMQIVEETEPYDDEPEAEPEPEPENPKPKQPEVRVETVPEDDKSNEPKPIIEPKPLPPPPVEEVVSDKPIPTINPMFKRLPTSDDVPSGADPASVPASVANQVASDQPTQHTINPLFRRLPTASDDAMLPASAASGPDPIGIPPRQATPPPPPALHPVSPARPNETTTFLDAMDIDDDLTAATQHNAQRQSADIINLFDALETPRKTPISRLFATIPDRGSLITGSTFLNREQPKRKQTIVKSNYSSNYGLRRKRSNSYTGSQVKRLPVPEPMAPKSAKKMQAAAAARMMETKSLSTSPEVFEKQLDGMRAKMNPPSNVSTLNGLEASASAPKLDDSVCDLYVTLTRTPQHTANVEASPAKADRSMGQSPGHVGEDVLLEREMRKEEEKEGKPVEAEKSEEQPLEDPSKAPLSPIERAEVEPLAEASRTDKIEPIPAIEEPASSPVKPAQVPALAASIAPKPPSAVASSPPASASANASANSSSAQLSTSAAERRVHETSYMSYYMINTGDGDDGEMTMVVTRKKRKRPKKGQSQGQSQTSTPVSSQQ